MWKKLVSSEINLPEMTQIPLHSRRSVAKSQQVLLIAVELVSIVQRRRAVAEQGFVFEFRAAPLMKLRGRLLP